MRGGGSVAGGGAAGRGMREGRPQPRLAPPRPGLAGPAASRPGAPRHPGRQRRSPELPRSLAAMAQHFSLAACDVVGFDLDHTLCRYNLPESAPVSGAGFPERTARSLRGGCGSDCLRAREAGPQRPATPRLCAQLRPRRGQRGSVRPSPCPSLKTVY